MICGDAADHAARADLILTDPPYDMPGARLAAILARYHAPHLVLLTSMRQLFELTAADPGWHLRFDFVFDAAVPKKSKSVHQPNYVHQTGVYMTRGTTKSAFDRRRRLRSDSFEANGYWPTILRAPRNETGTADYAKNLDAITDLLGSFHVQSVVDPFAGSFTTLLAAYELGIDCIAIEKDPKRFEQARILLEFVGCASELKIMQSR